MRVTFNQVRDGIDAINVASEQFAEAQWQVSTGLRVRVPSDDAAAAQRAVNDQATIDELDGYRAVADSASSRLTALESALGNIVDQLTHAMTAVQSAQGTTATQAVRDAASLALAGARDAIAADINGSFNGTHLFSGTNSDRPAYLLIAGGWVYQGTDTPTTVNVDADRTVTIAMDGQAILQGSDAQDVLTALDSLAAAARDNDATALAAGMDSLKSAFARATRALGQVGYDQSSLADGNDRQTSLRLAAKARLSSDQEANMAEAMTRMSRAQTTYQAALGAVAAASKVSLLDYLK
jgi:flagellar hook-associated protein 3 FlgL